MLYAWHLTLNSTGTHTILNLKRQGLTVFWSDCKIHMDTCMPDVCSPTYAQLFCLQYLPQSPHFGSVEKESHQALQCLGNFFLIILLSCQSYVFSSPSVFIWQCFSESTSHFFFSLIMENLGLIVPFYFVFTFNIWIMTNGGVKSLTFLLGFSQTRKHSLKLSLLNLMKAFTNSILNHYLIILISLLC